MSLEDAKDIVNIIESCCKKNNCTEEEACEKEGIPYCTYSEAQYIIKKYELNQKEYDEAIEGLQKIVQSHINLNNNKNLTKKSNRESVANDKLR